MFFSKNKINEDLNKKEKKKGINEEVDQRLWGDF